ncbi:two-component system response regulator [Thiosulfatimonas sediminis]|uniref:Two-component system response regulator n=1 Tax=Thiosulfatimonas sediminis TaxID=2675054 RepID=A0A6F8PU02_9GAMM|nr:response regulator [Thiosulfatimonas sediminis]BBP45589.1 two-component system response regulator [Thiosulfatimonas sediminis]
MQAVKKHQHKILIVEDEPIFVNIISEFIGSCGYDFDTAANGKQALEMLLAQPVETYSAILSDIEMPTMSGLELLKEVKSLASFAHIPFVLQTSHTDSDMIRRGIEGGAYYYLTKPLQPKVVCQIINAAILDFGKHQALVSKIENYKSGLDLLQSARFTLKTPEQAKHLAVSLCHLSAQPVKTSMGVYELVQNAIEHGNLGISYQEKGELIKERTFLAEIHRRLEHEDYQNRYVTIDYQIDETQKWLTISDMGAGFDFEQYLEFIPERLLDEHGRGIMMARVNGFQSIEYSNQGRTVRCLLY